MAYKRPRSTLPPLSKQEKLNLLAEYLQHYRELIAKDKSFLNRKAPRAAFAHLLDRIGEILWTESEELSQSEGQVQSFLKANPLPSSIEKRLPDDFRAFCLVLNALKQWVVAEQAAADRYLLGADARKLCREASNNCLATDSILGPNSELHHPVRDGRPPILLSKEGHTLIEKQQANFPNDPIGRVIVSLRRERNRSWAQLRRGCLDLLGKPVPWSSKGSAANARAFARKAAKAAGVGYAEILAWLDENGS